MVSGTFQVSGLSACIKSTEDTEDDTPSTTAQIVAVFVYLIISMVLITILEISLKEIHTTEKKEFLKSTQKHLQF